MSGFEEDWKLLEATGHWLRERHYVLAESLGPGPMSSGLHRFVGERIGVVIWADRGQWFIDVQPDPGSDERFDLESWSICLGKATAFHDTRPRYSEQDWLDGIENSWWLTPQVDYLRAHLDDIEAASHPARLQQTTDCLALARAALRRDYRAPNTLR